MIGWWSSSTSLKVASTRLRGLLIMRALQGQGLAVEWFDRDRSARYEAVVLGKRYDDRTFDEAMRLQQRGCRIVADLCDNHFFNPSGLEDWAIRASQLRRLLDHADRVVASTPELADVIAKECPGAPRAAVIGDPPDDLRAVPRSIGGRARATARLAALRARLLAFRVQGRTGLVWFGNHGVPYADGGMLDLVKLRPRIEALARTRRVFLTVISNHRRKFEEHVAPWRVPTAYLEWDAASFPKALAAHDVALIPVNRNGFTWCKTDNRVVTALCHGLAVVADAIPSYEAYRGTIGLDDWDAGLERYIEDEALRSADVERGLRVALDRTDIGRIAAQWREVLCGDAEPREQNDG
jgi:hypothetical protein